MRNRFLMVALLATLTLWLGASGASAAGQRVALAIGVSAYAESPLPSPVKDASEVANALAGFGFDVTLVRDPNSAQFKAAVDAFIAKARGASAAVVYFSGHGWQVNGEVYMMASDTQTNRPELYQRDELSVNGIVDRLQAAGVNFKFVIVDACRSNPFLDANGRSAIASANAGRAERRSPAPNTLISFASASGQNSQDWGSSIGLSLYTAALLDVMKRNERIDVRDLTQQTRALVQEYLARRGNNGEGQMPWEGSSLMGAVHLERNNAGTVAVFRGETGPRYAERQQDTGRQQEASRQPRIAARPFQDEAQRQERAPGAGRQAQPRNDEIRHDGDLAYDASLDRGSRQMQASKPRGQMNRRLSDVALEVED